jgi:hypothetical protein
VWDDRDFFYHIERGETAAQDIRVCNAAAITPAFAARSSSDCIFHVLPETIFI